ncbi:sugar transferase [Micromonospora sp. DT48]|uniref:sugar transferase n=1 Tax=unclassified Micromonospora TaxID=2617518 RepID=UPI0012BC1DDC|nr:sugar transferase [Micromonospora sp. CP22]MTK02905.1 sugar transferase [Micromonospora sp. CP22]
MSKTAQLRVKRVLDIALALVVLVLSAPVMAVAALCVRLQLGAPVFFVQERTGRGQRPFRIIKLRTMSDERDSDGNLLADGIRCRGVGRLLRRLSIDELPQLVNVVRGDLSLVGPRPLLPRYDDWYRQRERRRFDVRPGITGLAQISGRNSLPWDDRLELDVRYVENWSLGLDLRILAATVKKVFSGSGVAVDPAAEMLDLDRERQLSCISS